MEGEASRYGLKAADLRRICQRLRQVDGLEQAVLFGSRAKGTHRLGSDIDLALKGELTLRDVFKLQEALDDLWLPYTFDICLYDKIEEPALRQHVDRVGESLLQSSSVPFFPATNVAPTSANSSSSPATSNGIK